MSAKHDFISNVSPRKQSWTLVVRVVRAWFGQDHKNKKLPFSMELVLMDRKGDQIGASIRRTLIYKFKEQLQEGMVFTISSFDVDSNSGSYRPSRNEYKLNFTINTKVKLSKTVLVPTNVYSFTPAPDVFNESYDNNYLVDVIGVMIGVGVEREYERDGVKTKMNVMTWIQIGRYRFKCTLFGEYVEELNSFLSSDESQNVVVAIMLTKVKLFQGKSALQNAFSSTRITFNPEIGETKTDTTSTPDIDIPLVPSAAQQLPAIVDPDPPSSPPRYPSRHRKSTQFPDFVYSTYSASFASFLTSIYSLSMPSSYKEAILDPLWQQAMNEELSALHKTDTWELVHLPSEKCLVGYTKSKLSLMGRLSATKHALLLKDFLNNMV
ncbi:replication protein A 70 kDa DNA-binding subunit-like [Medicago truncatula]|uniref:replication protein A 70 kDa DNA-binding subunit-like n=1 Tax=Medicago truncatula TaxID=3880 RepID=UPI001967DB6C|nr:replication protein A 70 kDa DNA-binding subunit-like [Medicago truncatula]